MAYTNSSLSCMRKISPNRNSPRNHKIDTITIHCVVGQMSVESLCSHFSNPNLGASCNYGIGPDGRICTVVDEADRSWCTSSSSNDNRAITIECASDAYYPYAINTNVWNALIKLCADICKRNGINKLVWSTNKSVRMNHQNGCNLTVHRDYDNKSCPGDYIYERLGQIAKEVNAKLGSNTPFKPYKGQVNANDGLNCRKSPVDGAVIKTYPDGTMLNITKEDGNWGYCGEGWVCLDWVTKIASINDDVSKEEENKIMDGKAFKKMFDEMRKNWQDNDAAKWSEPARNWAVENGIISGVSSDKFNGAWEDLMTREQMVMILYRFAKLMSEGKLKN